MKQSYRKMDKKGVISDFPFIVVMLFVMGIIILFTHNIYTELNDSIDQSGVFDGSNTSQEILVNGQTTINGFDFIFVMVFVLLGLGLLVSAFLLDTHPIFFFIILIMMVFLVIVVALLTNTFEDVSGDAALANSTATFPMTTYMVSHFPVFAVIIIFMSAIVFYGKLRNR